MFDLWALKLSHINNISYETDSNNYNLWQFVCWHLCIGCLWGEGWRENFTRGTDVWCRVLGLFSCLKQRGKKSGISVSMCVCWETENRLQWRLGSALSKVTLSSKLPGCQVNPVPSAIQVTLGQHFLNPHDQKKKKKHQKNHKTKRSPPRWQQQCSDPSDEAAGTELPWLNGSF